MPVLMLLNGPPGVGKSTLAARLAQDRPLTLALDVDSIKHSLGRWAETMPESGLAARRLASAMAGEHLRAGHDVIVGQYLAKTDYIVELEALAAAVGAQWVEIVLQVDVARLRDRLARRAAALEGPDQRINATLTSAADAERLIRSLASLASSRPRAVGVDTSGSVEDVADRIRRHWRAAPAPG